MQRGIAPQAAGDFTIDQPKVHASVTLASSWKAPERPCFPPAAAAGRVEFQWGFGGQAVPSGRLDGGDVAITPPPAAQRRGTGPAAQRRGAGALPLGVGEPGLLLGGGMERSCASGKPGFVTDCFRMLHHVPSLVMSDAQPTEPFYLVVADHSLRVFCIEGPMTDEQPWQIAARRAREAGREVVCGPSGADPNALAAECRRTHNLAGVPPGSIVRTNR